MDLIVQRLTTQAKGLEDVVAGKSSICYIDGHEGRLLYRGYDIGELAAHSTWEETTYLLWNGELPTVNGLRHFSEEMASKRPIPREVVSILSTLPRNCDTMDALRVGVAALGIFDDPMYTQQEKAMSIASKIGTLVAAIHRHKHDQEILIPRDDLSFAANFLYMITGEVPTEEDTRLMDVFLILHADHEFNASTFTARVVASTLSDIYSAITGAVGALKGPLHGGANEKVVEMTNEIGSPARVDSYIHAKLASKTKINGFGHRVYKTVDPRARILKNMAEHFVQTEREKANLEIIERTEAILREEKNLYPNVDLYSGLALNHIGIPSYLFTPVFAVGRTPGWLAHVLEQYSDNRIIRPVADYVGHQLTSYVPIERRSAAGAAR
ncbi:MAG: citrate/2-methylcitrate synthase [Nitrososphaerota archaeon]|nr:citrate/2-methylcitrate synthase [Nitrososphaerota archaeon]MDG7023882.1 citrate/2-methylcitrate synthase [Nitrososphaerota archaeon]